MPRVLHVINTLATGGGAAHLALLTTGLRALSYESEVLAGVDGAGGDRLREAAVRVTTIGPLRARAPASLARAIAASAPDLVHLHGTRAGFFGALATRRAPHVPLVYTGHALAFHRREAAPLRAVLARVEAFTARHAAAILLLTESDRTLALARGFPPGRTFVVPNGIDVERFARATGARAALGVPPGVPLVGWIGRFVDQKHPDAMIPITRRVQARRPDAHVVLVGDGPRREKLARALASESRVHVLGERSDVPAILASLDVYVTTARWEGLPLGVMEAMAAGRAVVASAIPAHAALLSKAGAGVLVGEGAYEAMGDAIADLLDQPALRAEMGARAQTAARASFTAATMVRRTAEIYDAIRAESRRPR